MRVRNITSNRSGRPVANQFEIWDDEGNYFFQSYDSIIVKVDKNGTTFLDRSTWDYSTTTGKYRNEVLGEGIAETRRKIEDNIYKLADLN